MERGYFRATLRLVNASSKLMPPVALTLVKLCGHLFAVVCPDCGLSEYLGSEQEARAFADSHDCFAVRTCTGETCVYV